ncbi:hypothetical protein ACTA71_010323 [Dictyostelium dimigraforme]
MNKNYIYINIFILLFINIIKSCPTFPKPIKIDQNSPLLLKTYNEIDQMIQSRMKSDNVESFVATIVYRDEIVFSKAYGKINPLDENSPNLTVNNNIRIASITKTFTSLMMFKLRDQGIIKSLDDDIRDYFPQFKINSIYKDKSNEKVTFRQLASHQGGLARETPCDRIDYGTTKCNDKVILSKLSKQFLISKQPNILSHYSNLGFSLLGRVLGESLKMKKGIKEQEAYEYWVTNNIFKPLGMKNTTFDFEMIKDNMAMGLYTNNNGNYSIAPITPSGWNSPGGGIFSTANDMAQFMIFLLRDEYQQQESGSFYLKESTINEFFSPMNLLRDGFSVYGIPFLHTYDTSNSIWISAKNGDLTGYHSNMAFVRPLKLGLFFSSLADISAPDIYINSTIDLLIPVYEILLNEAIQKQKQQEQQNYLDEEMDPIIPNSFLAGLYIDLYGNEFIIYNETLNNDIGGNLLVNFDNSTSNLTIHTFELDKDYPYIKRISYYNENQQGCRLLAGGDNEELIYFTFLNKDDQKESNNYNDITNLQVYSVQVMGLLLYKI